MGNLIILTTCVFVITVLANNAAQQSKVMEELQATVNNWTEYLHESLYTLSEAMTRRRRTARCFKNTRIVNLDGSVLLEEIAKDIRKMMEEKVNAVKRIQMHAEALSCQRKADIETDSDYDFFDADNFTNTNSGDFRYEEYLQEKEIYWKRTTPNNMPYPGADVGCGKLIDSYPNATAKSICCNKPVMSGIDDNVMLKPGKFRNLTLEYHPHFDERVNLNVSVIRSTVSVFTRDKVILNNIRWSEPLDLTFKCNRYLDPTLTWQYFASSSGFMRLYPAMAWSSHTYDKTYDHRTRSWYTESMTSPKDMIILLDRSGSMNGKRKLISRQIVHDILDTLADNDYVNLLTFANSTEPLIRCFNDTLVQANEENLRLIRENLTQYEVKFPGRVDLAFKTAFNLLKQKQWKREEHLCSQVIMVIAEGLDYFDDAAFDKLDKENRDEKNNCRVRIFTYLLETLQSDGDVMLKIACRNMGYYVNISSVAEIREKVNMYTNVLSRSVNLNRNQTVQPIWSALYVDLADRRLTNWLWQKTEGLRQRQLFVNYTIELNIRNAFTNETVLNQYKESLGPRKYVYLTTVSLPVYDKRDGIATLLGVAAVDVPIDYMKKLTRPYKLGVNGYAFIITNNGYVLMHPDHRTRFKTILKPTFNRVDVTEVELSNATVNPREFDNDIIQLRSDIVNQKTGTTSLVVMTHMDDMKRIFFTERHYYYTIIEPYSLVIALQDNYGHKKLEYNFDNDFNPYRIFLESENETWTLHPDWYENMFTLGETRRADTVPPEKLMPLLSRSISSSENTTSVKFLILGANSTSSVFVLVTKGTNTLAHQQYMNQSIKLSKLLVHKSTPFVPFVTKTNTEEEEFAPRIRNLTDVVFSEDEMDLLYKGMSFSGGTLNEKTLINFLTDVEVATTRQPLVTKALCTNIISNETSNLIDCNRVKGNKFNLLLNSIKCKIKIHKLIFSKADKGNTLVILKEFDYRSKMIEILSDQMFVELDKDPSQRYQKDIRSLIKKTNLIEEEHKLRFSIMNPVAPKLYGLPKIHKEEIPLRPVVSYVQAPSYNICKLVNEILPEPIDFKPKYTVKNSLDLIDKLQNISVNHVTKLVSFDVKSLFTSIPILEVKDILHSGIKKHCPDKSLEIEEMLNLCLDQNYFQFGDNFYQQTNGLPMGSPLSPLLADIFVDHFEVSLFDKYRAYTTPVSAWFRLYFKGMRTMLVNGTKKTIKQLMKEHLMMCTYNGRDTCSEDPHFELLSMFLQDLRWTYWFKSHISRPESNKSNKYHATIENLYKNSVVTFISTHSGLTRWKYLPNSDNEDIEKNFGETNNKSIDEIWYKMAVEEKIAYPENITYIFSIPLVDEMEESKEFDESQLVTVTQAIFREEKISIDHWDRTPAAVVGYQMKYTALKRLFESLECEKYIDFGRYDQENISCVILDNHGYILWSNNESNIGRLILQHSINITQKLEDDGIFLPTNVFDYQGICLPNATIQTCPSSGEDKCRYTSNNITLGYQKRAIQKTVPTPCDKEMRMYTYTYTNTLEEDDHLCPYIIQFIPNTNLALLIYETNCYVDNLREELKETYPKEKKYGETGKLHLPCFIETNNNYFKRPYINCRVADKTEQELNKNKRYCGGNDKHFRDEL